MLRPEESHQLVTPRAHPVLSPGVTTVYTLESPQGVSKCPSPAGGDQNHFLVSPSDGKLWPGWAIRKVSAQREMRCQKVMEGRCQGTFPVDGD